VLGSKITLYLLLDQFEEFFNLLDKNEREPFLESLADCLNDPSLKVRWVLALRAEALSDLAELEAFGIAPFKNMYRLNRLNRAEAQEAIIEPAKRYKIKFEKELIDHILDSLNTNGEVTPTQLQLVCSALTDDLPADQTLTLRYYIDHEGDTEGILRDYLKRQLEHLPAEEQAPAWKVLRALITADRLRDLKTYDELVEELRLSGVSKEQIDLVLARLVERRLLATKPSTTETFELAHDYLVKEIELDPQEQARKAAQELLDDETRNYKRHKTLLAAERLAVIEPYRNELVFSDDAQKLFSESQKNIRTGKRRRSTILAGISIVAVVVAIAMTTLWINAQKQANIALARQLAAQAQSIRGAGDSEQIVSILLAIQSMKIFPTNLASEVLLGNTSVQPTDLRGYEGWVNSVSFSANGEYILSTGCDQFDEANFICTQYIASVLDAGTGEQLVRMPLDQEVRFVVFSEDGQFLATASTDKNMRVWDVFTGNEVAHMPVSGVVHDIVFSPDGNLIASGACGREDDNGSCAEGILEVWDTTTGKRIDQMRFESQVNCLAFSLNSGLLVSGIDNGIVHVWDITAGTQVAYPMHEGGVFAVAFSPDGEHIVSGGFDNTARVWESSTGNEIAYFEHSGTITSVAFSPSGDYVISANEHYPTLAGGSYDATVWESFTGMLVASKTHEDRVTSVAYSPNDKHVLSVSGDGTIRVWEAATGNELTRRWESDFIHSASFSPDGKYVVVGSETGSVLLWNVQGDRPIDLITQEQGVSNVAFSLDGKYAIAAGLDGMIHVWETDTGLEVSSMTYQLTALTWNNTLAISPDNRYIIASGDDNETARMWEVATGSEIIRGTYDEFLHSIAFSPDGKFVVAVEGEKDVLVWEVTTGREVVRVAHDEEVTSATFSPNSQYVVSGSNDETARVWEAATGNEVARMTHTGPLSRVAFSPDGQLVVSAGCDTSVYIYECTQSSAIVWNVTTGKEVTRFIHAGWISSVAFSRDGKYVITGSWDHTARVWKSLTGKEVARMTHEAEVSSVGFSPDGKYAASGGCDAQDFQDVCTRGSARIWETSTGNEISRMLFDESVNSVAFNPNGKYVMAGGGQSAFEVQSKALRVWMYLPEDVIADACARTSRNLTRIEYAIYINSDPEAYNRDYAKNPTCKELPIEPAVTPSPTP
jgi:WD40 repeat protein